MFPQPPTQKSDASIASVASFDICMHPRSSTHCLDVRWCTVTTHMQWSHLPFIYRRTLAKFSESPMVSIWHGFHFHIAFFLRRLSFCMVWGKPNDVHDHCLSALINQNFEQISHGLAWHGTKLGALPTFSYIPRHCLVSLHCTIPSLEILKYKVHTVMYNKVFSRSADGVHVL